MSQLLKNIKPLEITGDINREIHDISCNSGNIREGGLFVAISGFKKDGHDFITEAIKNGAAAVIAQKKVKSDGNFTQIIVSEPREALARISSNFYGNPSSALTLTGITGTNGKTTTTFLIDSVLKFAGKKTSMITTIESFILDKKISFDRTTPGSLELNKFSSDSVKSGAEFLTMEVSSHAIDLHRVDFLDFDFFIFTNLTHDHLDYHENMMNYFDTKKRLFVKEFRELYSGKGAVINADDIYGKQLLDVTDLQTLSYSVLSKDADIMAENISSSTTGIGMDVLIKNKGNIKIKSELCGYFNVYNILAAIGACVFLNIDLDIIPGSRIITVFGCGGDRDKTKRYIMGSIAGKVSDFLIITSDNPRTEDPASIINMIECGVKETDNKNYLKIPDRTNAIEEALNTAAQNDIVIIAGKGHEDYQEFNGYRIYFSDQKIVKDWALKRK
ncbi:MAG: UDP-N-acetylmuramoyl-L-alanyl-D-glutamate--2,6-diaminopimelate ligase [Actinobacteria bacterium]|nr:UDP-N-acetylmuramoyl-L-alanyl-D-glutamate--2,6-diaminopimelate ligase [Actinomycetota bacterium]